MGYVIGLSAYYHDSSVCLFKNGELIFAIEEEKFTGIKHDNSFPRKSLDFIFKTYDLNKDKIDVICYYENPKLKLKRVLDNIKNQWYRNPLYSLKSYFNIRNNIKELEIKLSNYTNKVFYSTHHESHIFYSYYTSNFKDSICLSIDGVGENDTTSIGIFEQGSYEYIPLSKYPHSIGLFYSTMTSYLGFKPNDGEFKLMGLASYGAPTTFLEKIRTLITFKNSKLECNMEFFTWDKSNNLMFNEKLIEFLGVDPRLPEEEILTIHMDLASSIQKVYEEIMFEILKTIGLINDIGDLCLGGGCAYNGTANGKILSNTNFKKLWIPPAPSDAGSSVGACLKYFHDNKIKIPELTKNPFLGPKYSNEYISKLVNGKKTYKFPSMNLLCEYVAKKINNGAVVGWFHGRCEFGSRALGNRSILASPLIDGMKDRINNMVKKREGFRPFAPAVTKERQNEFFVMDGDVPYMNQVVQVKPDYRDILKATTHIDGSARVQTVYKDTTFYNLLREFEKVSGYPILLNTSFNIKDKTMVLTPEDAINTFYNSDIDILVLNNYIIIK